MSVSGYLPAYCLTGQNTVPAPEIKPNQSRYGDLLPNDAVEFPKKGYSREVPGTMRESHFFVLLSFKSCMFKL